jgi:valyl-tRNA synthetase
LAKPALEAVMNDTIKLHPAKFKNTYRHWMENVKDWCISRQLWWGHRIPAYFLPEGGFVVADSDEKAVELAIEKTGNKNLTINDLRQDEDCLDTWFSSWLWPISVFDGINKPENEEIKYYYPTNELVTGPDILFFWVARMIISGYEYKNEKCFENVYLTGIVRDKLGRKMSKSLGNSPDPIELIEKFGADGVRMGMMLAAPAGNDIHFDEALCEQGRNFNNKIWNALRLVTGWEVADITQPKSSEIAIEWFDAKLSEAIVEIDDLFSKYRLSEALMCVYKLFWDEFSSWYLEVIKPAYQQPIDKKTFDATLELFEKLLKLLHPFMPFITEELYQVVKERVDNDSIMIANMPVAKAVNASLLAKFEEAKEIVSGIRTIRLEKNLPNKNVLDLQIISTSNTSILQEVVMKMGNLSSISTVFSKDATSASFLVGTTEYAVPLEDKIDVEEEIKKMQDEIAYLKGFLKSVEAKLSNERFVANAKPEIVENERKKQADAESKMKSLEDSILALKK